MKMSHLLYFKTAAEMGRLSLAAQKLSVASPTLSIAIKNLEKELGVPLFIRHSNRIVLNEQGKAYLYYVNRILDQLELAKQEIQSMASAQKNTEETL